MYMYECISVFEIYINIDTKNKEKIQGLTYRRQYVLLYM